MFVVAATFAVFLMLLTAAALAVLGGYRVRDLLLLGFLTSITLYLSRFDAQFSATLLGRPYVGLDFYLLIVVVVLLPLRILFREVPGLRITSAVLLMGAFATLSLISGLLNKGFIGVGAAIQVLVITFAPAAVAALWVEVMPRDRRTHHRMMLSFVLLVGVFTPLVFLLTSLAPNLLGSLLGWSTVAAGRSAGFVRGWSPLGGPIATGMLMVIAYGFAMHEVVGRRKRLFAVVLVLVGVALLFTLSRSVMLMFILFHVVYFWSAIRRQPIRILGLGTLAVIVMAPLMFQLMERYSFERFTRYQDESTDIRASSAIAALEASFEKPFLGHGPGLLYEQIRVEGVVGGDATRMKAMYVGGRISALEPHNLYLLLAAEHGWPAAITFVFGLLLLWRHTRVGPRTVDDEDRSMGAAVHAIWVACLFMFLTYSGPLVNTQSSVFFWMFVFIGQHWRATVAACRVAQPTPTSGIVYPGDQWRWQPVLVHTG